MNDLLQTAIRDAVRERLEAVLLELVVRSKSAERIASELLLEVEYDTEEQEDSNESTDLSEEVDDDDD